VVSVREGRVMLCAQAAATLMALLQLRLRAFQHGVRRLLQRNVHLAVILLVLLGLPLAYNPEILGLPLLDLTRPSFSLSERLMGAWIFFAGVLAWVSLMRSAARGGEPARYVRSMPLDRRCLELVEVAMAAAAAGIAWVPVLVAVAKAGVAVREGASPVAACAVFAAMALTTLALSRALLAERGAVRIVALIAVASTLAWADGGRLMSVRTLGPVLATWMFAGYVLGRPAAGGPGAAGTRLPWPALPLLRVPPLAAHSIQLKTLFVEYAAGTAGKLALASLFTWAAAWQTVNNLQPEAGVLVRHVLLGMALFVLAGLHHSLLDARAPYLRYLRSLPLALAALRRADHRVVCALSLAVVLTGLWLGGGVAGRAHPARVLLEAGYYSGMTLPGGSQWMLERPDTTIWSAAFAVLASMVGFWLFS
jgi:hypothetical protein